MLVADGLTREQFTMLWRDAMITSPDAAERARLVLELGRCTLREAESLDPMMVVLSERREPPFVIVPLPEVPTEDHPVVREAARERLAELAASEVFVLVLLAANISGGHRARLLVSWGESLSGDEVVWMQPIRWVDGVREEAPVVRAPLAEHTEISRRCRGLLLPPN
jgi:hypothetical protein